MATLHDELVRVLCDDHSIREPGRIAKLVMSVINPFLTDKICSDEDAAEVFKGIRDGSCIDAKEAYKMLLLKTENRFG